MVVFLPLILDNRLVRMNLRHNVLVFPLSYEGEFRRLPVVVVALAQESLDAVGVVPLSILEYVPLTQVRSVVDDILIQVSRRSEH